MATAFNSGFNSNIDASALATPLMFNRSINDVLQLANANSALSEQYASNSRDFSRQMQQVAMNFNAQEAAKNRMWQSFMSNTAHQREVEDLIAAGLNPVLSASGGNGAAIGSGAAASVGIPGSAQGQVDSSASSGFVQLLVSVLGAMTNIATSATSANAVLGAANLNSSAARYGYDLSSYTEVTKALLQGDIEKYKSDNSAAATFDSSTVGAIANLIGSVLKFVKK